MEEEIESIKKENEELKSKLKGYQILEEELMAKRVFEKAKGKLVQWYTIGGIALFVVGIIGIKSIIDYSKEIAQSKLEEMTIEQLNEIMENETKEQVSALIVSKQSIIEGQLEVYTKQKISEINISTSPISGNKISDDTIIDSDNNVASKVDFTSSYGEARNQGNEGSTVAFAVTSAMEFQYQTVYKTKVKLSPRYLYNSINNGRDMGATFINALDFSSRTGIIEDKHWEYESGDYQISPSEEMKSRKHYKIEFYRRLNSSLEDVKRQLRSRNAIISGIIIYKSNYSQPNGKMAYPKSEEQPIGGHAICIVGYDDNKEIIKFKNSWGKEWGDNGYGYIPYSDFEKLVKESYIIRVKDAI